MIPTNIKEVIDAYVRHGRDTGDFVRACLENDLRRAVTLADELNVLRLRDIVHYLHNECPGLCWGSKNRVADWLKDVDGVRTTLVGPESQASPIRMIAFEASSAVKAAGYDDKTGVLQIEFTGGTLYQYQNVDPVTWVHFKNAKSKGGFVANVLRGRFEAVRIDSGKEVDIVGQLEASIDAQKNCAAVAQS